MFISKVAYSCLESHSLKWKNAIKYRSERCHKIKHYSIASWKRLKMATLAICNTNISHLGGLKLQIL